METTYQVSGMTCQHCVGAVTEEVSKVAGVSSVSVALKPGEVSAVTVTSDEPIGDALIAEAVDEAGYEVVK